MGVLPPARAAVEFVAGAEEKSPFKDFRKREPRLSGLGQAAQRRRARRIAARRSIA